MREVQRLLAVLLLLVARVGTAAASPDGDLLALQRAVVRAIDRAEPGVACVLVSRSDAYAELKQGPPSSTPGSLGGYVRPPFDPRDEKTARAMRALDLSDPDVVPESYGSGLVIHSSGLVLTCAHVIHKATKIYVRLPDGQGSWADIQASDPRSDLAVLQLRDTLRELRTVSFGDASGIRKGQFVIGLANPYASGHRDGSPAAAWGIISNVRRRAPGVITETDRALQSFHRFGTLFQTDVRLGPGCSGGALLNTDGEVIGITTALAGLTGLDAPGGFAVPVDARMKKIVTALAEGKEVEYGFLGVTLRTDRHSNGAQIGDPVPNSPAAKAGLKAGDVILSINGNRVRDTDDLLLQIGSLTAGSEVRLEVLRNNGHHRATLRASLAKLYVPEPPIASFRPNVPFGLRVDYVSVLAQRSIGSVVPDGVVIREVVPGSAAGQQPLLLPDRVIVAVNGTSVTSPDEYNRAIQQFPDHAQLTVINADRQRETVELKTP